MKKLALILVSLLFATSAMASVSLKNEDSRQHQLLLKTSDTCFSGTHTSINGHTTSNVDPGWACVDKKKPAVKLENGKSYVIRNGRIVEK